MRLHVGLFSGTHCSWSNVSLGIRFTSKSMSSLKCMIWSSSYISACLSRVSSLFVLKMAPMNRSASIELVRLNAEASAMLADACAPCLSTVSSCTCDTLARLCEMSYIFTCVACLASSRTASCSVLVSAVAALYSHLTW